MCSNLCAYVYEFVCVRVHVPHVFCRIQFVFMLRVCVCVCVRGDHD